MIDLTTTNDSERQPYAGVVSVLNGPWHDCLDDRGGVIAGIRGVEGASAILDSGLELGIDLLEIAPGSGFAPHTHEGGHILVGVSGCGELLFAGQTFVIHPGETIYVPAHVPHAVKASRTSEVAFSVLAVGYPHKKVYSQDRMQLAQCGFSQ